MDSDTFLSGRSTIQNPRYTVFLREISTVQHTIFEAKNRNGAPSTQICHSQQAFQMVSKP
jgi:hypothetical protein